MCNIKEETQIQTELVGISKSQWVIVDVARAWDNKDVTGGKEMQIKDVKLKKKTFNKQKSRLFWSVVHSKYCPHQTCLNYLGIKLLWPSELSRMKISVSFFMDLKLRGTEW